MECRCEKDNFEDVTGRTIFRNYRWEILFTYPLDDTAGKWILNEIFITSNCSHVFMFDVWFCKNVNWAVLFTSRLVFQNKSCAAYLKLLMFSAQHLPGINATEATVCVFTPGHAYRHKTKRLMQHQECPLDHFMPSVISTFSLLCLGWWPNSSSIQMGTFTLVGYLLYRFSQSQSLSSHDEHSWYILFPDKNQQWRLLSIQNSHTETSFGLSSLLPT